MFPYFIALAIIYPVIVIVSMPIRMNVDTSAARAIVIPIFTAIFVHITAIELATVLG
jgi:hypothetical protein